MNDFRIRPAGRFLTRRQALLLAGGGLLAAPGLALGQQVIKDIKDLKPGEFTWHPDRQPDGPLAIVVSIPEQLVHVYRNGVRIAVSTCSTGKPGHDTPTGVFVVLQKDKNHHSSTYNDAPMPNMNRLTWSGVALHAGKLPGYPASHGCVRLPLAFSADLFGVTHIGTPVIISGAHSDPFDLTHPGLVLGAYAAHEFDDVVASLDGKKAPADWASDETYPVTTIIASAADRKVELIENDKVIASGGLTLKGDGPLGSHVLVLKGASDAAQGMHWIGLTHAADPVGQLVSDEDALNRLTADKDFVDQMRAKLHPGAIMILTDLPLTPDSRTGDDFVIVDGPGDA
jgi:hypothetical protein